MKNLFFVFSIVLIFTACSEDSSGPKDSPNPNSSENIFYFNKMDMDSEDDDSDIAKYNMNTGQEEIIIKSSALVSPPAKGKMLFLTDSILRYDEYDDPVAMRKLILSDIDGTNQEIIKTINEENDEQFYSIIFSPQADKIVYQGSFYNEETDETNGMIVICDVDGSNEYVISEPGHDLSFSNDGKRVAFTENPDRLLIYDVALKRITVEVNGVNLGGFFRSGIMWSRDDSKLFFTAQNLSEDKHELVIVNSDGTDLRRIFNDKDIDFLSPSHVNSKLVFRLWDRENDAQSIVQSDIDGNNQQVFLDGKNGERYFVPLYCPDGETMLINMSEGGIENSDEMSFYKVDIATKEITKLFDHPLSCVFER